MKYNKVYFCAKVCVLTSIIGLLQACTILRPNDISVQHVAKKEMLPLRYYPEFGEKPKLLRQEELFQLTSEQEKKFLLYLDNPNNRDELRHRSTSNYLSKIIGGFSYHGGTFIASKAASEKQGNCLSLAILTTALARVAGVDVGYELVHSVPVYQKKGNIVISSQHVRSILYQPEQDEDENERDQQKLEGLFYWFRPVVKVDYFPTRNSRIERKVSETEFISMYYRNKAAEALVEERFSDAFWLARESLDFSENNTQAANMIALVYDNLGYTEDAEKLYLFSNRQSGDQLESLSNYYYFLLKNNRNLEAEKIKMQIAEIGDTNPFDWLKLANNSFGAARYGEALKYYEKVIELAPYLHQGYSGKGKVEYLKGHTRRAKKAFNKAAELAFESEALAMYNAKLFALDAEIKN